MIQCIVEHSVDVSLITKGGVCIDAGCRGFEFSKVMRDLGMNVKAFDLEEMEVPEGIEFQDKAIGDRYGNMFFRETSDQQAKHISESGTIVYMIPLSEYVKAVGKVDVIKLDIEAYEIPVIMSLTEAPAKQLSIEFHMHTGTTNEQVMKCFDHLYELGYELAFKDYSDKHGCGWNYWDVLFINKNIK